MSASVAVTPSPPAGTEESKPQNDGPEASTQLGKDGLDGKDASTYGTRSRHRGPRPNYSEADNDLDFLASPTKKTKEKDATGPATKTTKQAQDKEGDGVIPKKNGVNKGGRPPKNPAAKAAAAAAAAAANNSATTSANGGDASESSSVTGAAPKKRKVPTGGVTESSQPTKQRKNAAGTTAKPQLRRIRDTQLYSFENCKSYLNGDNVLVADDKTEFRLNDYIYMVCEPPGEPYYIARIMEFLHQGNDTKNPVDSIRINWVYRARDIGRKTLDTRLLFVSMHSDPCPLAAIRGNVTVQHRSKIADLEAYRKQRDSFYYVQMYDRYIHRYYEVIPTTQVINVPERVKKVLDDRWEFVIVESGRARELTSAAKICKRCAGYSAKDDSVDCAVCKTTYHMNCVQPPLLKKPARGFAWSCGPCSRQAERKLEAKQRQLASIKSGGTTELEEELAEDDEDMPIDSDNMDERATSDPPDAVPLAEASEAQIAQTNLWPYRYLGIHCKLEDVLDYDDRLYPRAATRLGPRHQCTVPPWFGRPLEYVKASEIKKRYSKGNNPSRKDGRFVSAAAAAEAESSGKESRPKWVLDEPAGFVHRGQDFPNSDSRNTARTVWKLPQVGETSERGLDDGPSKSDKSEEEVLNDLDKYMKDVREYAPNLGLQKYHTNYLTKALEVYYACDRNATAAMEQVKKFSLKKDLKEPTLNKEELKRFEEGVTQFGSSIIDIWRLVGKGQKYGDLVRFYYTWKKTERGQQIWGNYEGRKGKKQAKQQVPEREAEAEEYADDKDDSAFDDAKAAKKKMGFECKFCNTRTSRRWRKAPNTAPGTTISAEPDSKEELVVALCQRCATLWRRYAIRFENIDEVNKKLNTTGGRQISKKQIEDLFIELVIACDETGVAISPAAIATAASLGVEVAPIPVTPVDDDKKKKIKVEKEKEVPVKKEKPDIHDKEKEISGPQTAAVSTEGVPKKKTVEKTVVEELPPLVPDQPKFAEFPCAVCLYSDELPNRYICSHCRVTVHRACYGIPKGTDADTWVCDICKNQEEPQYSILYECVLCPVKYNDQLIFEAPKASHKKKTDREREKERLEKELVAEATAGWEATQKSKGWPISPYEALKPTANNKWVHIACAMFHAPVMFKTPEIFDIAEDIPKIPLKAYSQTCRICRGVDGACLSCKACGATAHATCAQLYSYPMGFEITPVKRGSGETTITLGEQTGKAEAVVYCISHTHDKKPLKIHTLIDKGTLPSGERATAMEVFARTFKQADLSKTAMMRKALALEEKEKYMSIIRQKENEKNAENESKGNVTTRKAKKATELAEMVDIVEDELNAIARAALQEAQMPRIQRACAVCTVDATPLWHPWAVKVLVQNQNGNGHTNAEPVYEEKDDMWRCHRCHSENYEHSSQLPFLHDPRLHPLPPRFAALAVPPPGHLVPPPVIPPGSTTAIPILHPPPEIQTSNAQQYPTNPPPSWMPASYQQGPNDYGLAQPQPQAGSHGHPQSQDQQRRGSQQSPNQQQKPAPAKRGRKPNSRPLSRLGTSNSPLVQAGSKNGQPHQRHRQASNPLGPPPATQPQSQAQNQAQPHVPAPAQVQAQPPGPAPSMTQPKTEESSAEVGSYAQFFTSDGLPREGVAPPPDELMKPPVIDEDAPSQDWFWGPPKLPKEWNEPQPPSSNLPKHLQVDLARQAREGYLPLYNGPGSQQYINHSARRPSDGPPPPPGPPAPPSNFFGLRPGQGVLQPPQAGYPPPAQPYSMPSARSPQAPYASAPMQYATHSATTTPQHQYSHPVQAQSQNYSPMNGQQGPIAPPAQTSPYGPPRRTSSTNYGQYTQDPNAHQIMPPRPASTSFQHTPHPLSTQSSPQASHRNSQHYPSPMVNPAPMHAQSVPPQVGGTYLPPMHERQAYPPPPVQQQQPPPPTYPSSIAQHSPTYANVQRVSQPRSNTHSYPHSASASPAQRSVATSNGGYVKVEEGCSAGAKRSYPGDEERERAEKKSQRIDMKSLLN